jgi:hypothetical protein
LGVAALDTASFRLRPRAPKHRGEAERPSCIGNASNPTQSPSEQADEDVEEGEGEEPADATCPPTLDARGDDECSCS